MDWRKLFQKKVFHCTIFIFLAHCAKWHCDEPICNFTRILVVVGVIKTLKSSIFYGKLVYYTSVLEPSFLPIYTYFYIYLSKIATEMKNENGLIQQKSPTWKIFFTPFFLFFSFRKTHAIVIILLIHFLRIIIVIYDSQAALDQNNFEENTDFSILEQCNNQIILKNIYL